ncbi:hypothetical protein LIER_17493 [Lithospermum erythrorhizon]|uniref:Uncharacterized protein n=1 Tax=Lithospermum erythrorhizon TaxID=34254 RepID=A0AAV3QBE4_LITER
MRMLELAEDQTPEEQVHVTVRPTAFGSSNPADEQQGDEVVHDSKDEDVAVVISRRRKAKGKLKINENRSRVGNKRIPKNVVVVSTENVALNSEEEKGKWKFVASRRIAVERMLSQVTKKNADSMGTHVANIPLRAIETRSGLSTGSDETSRFIRDEIKHLDSVIQSSLARKSVLEARLKSLAGEDDPRIDPAGSDSEAEASHELCLSGYVCQFI